ncbi:hypothetical protein O9929_07570 [Vibrio lentus]|nr:hypothetical protein [Vibrio lentus]
MAAIGDIDLLGAIAVAAYGLTWRWFLLFSRQISGVNDA